MTAETTATAIYDQRPDGTLLRVVGDTADRDLLRLELPAEERDFDATGVEERLSAHGWTLDPGGRWRTSDAWPGVWTAPLVRAAEEVARLRAELAAATALAADATEYRVMLPHHGGTELRLRRAASPTEGWGWSVAVPARGGGMAWTTLGWQDSISALSVKQLFCWPTAEEAIDQARTALAHLDTDRSQR
ncbi:MAG: hypothetical protein ACTH0H_05785 [Brachybacterium sp.]